MSTDVEKAPIDKDLASEIDAHIEDRLPPDEELLKKADRFIRDRFSRFGSLEPKEQDEAIKVLVMTSFIKNADKIADELASRLLDTAKALHDGVCHRCGSKPAEGPETCVICEAIREVRKKMEVKIEHGTDTDTPGHP